ncbi:hypothetical protein QGN31_14265 [Mycobacterium sp. 2-64]|nr:MULTISPECIES: hypothetical protein [Mycobacterium]WSE49410.1 hypothetical protein QGN31_14265 [Mycobacterium sp. 2-64]
MSTTAGLAEQTAAQAQAAAAAYEAALARPSRQHRSRQAAPGWQRCRRPTCWGKTARRSRPPKSNTPDVVPRRHRDVQLRQLLGSRGKLIPFQQAPATTKDTGQTAQATATAAAARLGNRPRRRWCAVRAQCCCGTGASGVRLVAGQSPLCCSQDHADSQSE